MQHFLRFIQLKITKVYKKLTIENILLEIYILLLNYQLKKL